LSSQKGTKKDLAGGTRSVSCLDFAQTAASRKGIVVLRFAMPDFKHCQQAILINILYKTHSKLALWGDVHEECEPDAILRGSGLRLCGKIAKGWSSW
jgi:hypothetical protein